MTRPKSPVIRLYTQARNPFSEKVAAALGLKKLAFERVISEDPEDVKRWSPIARTLPVLEIDGAAVTQSNAMCRYVGKMADLYPDDDLQALYCDEAMDAIEDLLHYIVHTFGLQGDELKRARKKLADGWLSVYLRGLDELLTRGGGDFFADNRMTVADLKVFMQTKSLLAGTLDHVPTDIVERLAPGLVGHKKRIESDPRVVAYYASRQ